MKKIRKKSRKNPERVRKVYKGAARIRKPTKEVEQDPFRVFSAPFVLCYKSIGDAIGFSGLPKVSVVEKNLPKSGSECGFAFAVLGLMLWGCGWVKDPRKESSKKVKEEARKKIKKCVRKKIQKCVLKKIRKKSRKNPERLRKVYKGTARIRKPTKKVEQDPGRDTNRRVGQAVRRSSVT